MVCKLSGKGYKIKNLFLVKCFFGLKKLYLKNFLNKLTTIDILLHFLQVLYEYKAVLVVLDALQRDAKDVLILN